MNIELSPLLFFVLLGCSSSTVTWRPDLTHPLDEAQWILDGSGIWEIHDEKLILAKAGVPAGAIRRPSAIAVLNSDMLKQATVEVQLRSLAPLNVSQRDLQIIVGYQSPTRFYYIHLAGMTDAVHNGIFLVDNADRQRIDDGTGVPQLLDQNWHDVRVAWNGQAGTIDVFVDDSVEPVLHATDTTLQSGHIGFGSFDDTGEFRNIEVSGVPSP